MPAFVKLKLHQGTKQKKNKPFYLLIGPYSQTLNDSSVAISSCFDFEASDGI